MYLEALVGESVRVSVAVDTSGSIDNEQLQMFLSEVQGILNAYPHLQCDLYYADAAAYGPYPLNIDSTMPSPQDRRFLHLVVGSHVDPPKPVCALA